MTRLGVMQKRALDGRRGSLHTPTVVRADDRFHGGVGVSLAIGSATEQSPQSGGIGTMADDRNRADEVSPDVA